MVSAELLDRDCRGHAALRGRAQPRPDRSQASGNRWIGTPGPSKHSGRGHCGLSGEVVESREGPYRFHV